MLIYDKLYAVLVLKSFKRQQLSGSPGKREIYFQEVIILKFPGKLLTLHKGQESSKIISLSNIFKLEYYLVAFKLT